jgi:hypothetical protein
MEAFELLGWLTGLVTQILLLLLYVVLGVGVPVPIDTTVTHITVFRCPIERRILQARRSISRCEQARSIRYVTVVTL